MALVDDLLANCGTYVGIDSVAGTDLKGAARIVIAPLPGNSGVTLNYEIFNPVNPDRIRGHHEHTVIAREASGRVVMVIGHPHANSVAILRETTPGVFEAGDEIQAFPMKVELSVTGPGQLRHVWWYGSEETGPQERDVTEARRVD